MSTTRTARAAAGAALLALSGCSWVFVDGPPAVHADLPYFTCTDSRTAPTMDMVLAVYPYGYLVWAGAQPESGSEGRGAVETGLLMGGLHIWSGVVGYKRVRECRAALLQLAERAQSEQVRAPTTPLPPGTAELIQRWRPPELFPKPPRFVPIVRR